MGVAPSPGNEWFWWKAVEGDELFCLCGICAVTRKCTTLVAPDLHPSLSMHALEYRGQSAFSATAEPFVLNCDRSLLATWRRIHSLWWKLCEKEELKRWKMPAYFHCSRQVSCLWLLYMWGLSFVPCCCHSYWLPDKLELRAWIYQNIV